ncbi:DUF502 domain-containing protein [Halosimplex rubrum]|uniref:DUF502 domain-containing protein n=1 Tax=Halosimplex rubrum TaxID=869889 RepID=A0A7D5SQE6_9EURY|nr:DUF502 domain-containing protein [Halosimplex rubrum]QLH77587.1 DUF502 domain-containing protein [Halosimplex rubrum]
MLLTEVVVILPLVATVYILKAALGFIAGALRPFIKFLQSAGLIEGVKQVGFVDLLITVGIYSNVVDFLTTIIAVMILTAIVVSVGLLARFRYGERVIDYFDYFVGNIPGAGSIYQSFRQMGEVVLESGVENFQSVKLVEFPFDDVYVIGFETSRSAPAVMSSAGNGDMVTLFLPLAPNPVMGGFLTHIPRGQVNDVDMTVEEAVQIIITSGIATEDVESGEFRELDPGERSELGDATVAGTRIPPPAARGPRAVTRPSATRSVPPSGDTGVTGRFCRCGRNRGA